MAGRAPPSQRGTQYCSVAGDTGLETFVAKTVMTIKIKYQTFSVGSEQADIS